MKTTRNGPPPADAMLQYVSEAQHQLYQALALVKTFAELNHQTAHISTDEVCPVRPSLAARLLDSVEEYLDAATEQLSHIEGYCFRARQEAPR